MHGARSMAVDIARAENRARRAYELGRARRATLLALPLVLPAALAGVLGEIPAKAAVIGVLLYVAGVALHWRGRDLAAGVLPGAAAGLVPLALGLLMRMHGCVGGS